MSETHEKGINVLRSRLAQKKPEDNKKSFKYNTTVIFRQLSSKEINLCDGDDGHVH